MKAIQRRLRHIEGQFLPEKKPQRLWAVCKPDWGLALDADRCMNILGECGFLPTERFGIVDFLQVPDGLNAEQLERFLRANGSETRWDRDSGG